MLSAKAQNLLQVITARGGGCFDEYWLRDKTGLSHGSIVAARQELVAEGLLALTKESRKLIYTLAGQAAEPRPKKSEEVSAVTSRLKLAGM